MQLDAELLAIFLGEIAGYQEILERPDADLEEQAAAAHGLKGAAGMVGFSELGDLAKALEQSLREGDTGPRDEHLPRIRELIADIAAGGVAGEGDVQEPTSDVHEAEEDQSAFDPETAALLQGFFMEEAADHLASMEAELDRLGEDPGDAEAIDVLFRASHTLKGAAATVDLHHVAEAAHLLEDRFEGIRAAGGKISPGEMDRLAHCVDLLRSIVSAEPEQVPDLHAKLQREVDMPLDLADPASPDSPAPAPEDDPLGEGMGWDEETAAIILETFRDEASELLDDLDPLLQELAGGSRRELDRLFRLAHTLKGSAGAVGMTRMAQAAHALEDTLELLRRDKGDAPPPDLTDVLTALRRLSTLESSSPEAAELLREVKEQLRVATGAGAAGADATTRLPTLSLLPATHPRATPPQESPLQDTSEPAVTLERRDRPDRRLGSRREEEGRMIRVNAERLDELLRSVGEIVFRRTLIERRSEELTGLVRDLNASHLSLRAAVVALRDLRGAERHVQRFSELEIEFADVLSNFERAEAGLKEETEGLRKDARYLQAGLTEIRLLSVRYLFARLRRSVREIARLEAKQVTLVVQGEDTEIDKVVAEKIADPMIQIIRNAVTHGIEPPEERLALGKPVAGTIAITATQENNFVTLEVSDDGRGIDLASIRAALIDRNLMSPEEARHAPDEEVTAAIFLPGLSTRQETTSVAGRGVGLDVVHDTISKLSGEVTVWSERSRGTRFTIRMPLSTAVTNALLFKTGGEVFCIPIRWVVETRSVGAGDVTTHRGREAVLHRDKTIPLLRLADLLGSESRVTDRRLPTIILRHLDFEFALMVDKLIGPREIVLRELGPLLEPLDIYAAATISGSGKVQLVLDVPTLHMWASAWRTLKRPTPRHALPGSPSQRILVCDDSRSIREVVSRILLAEGYTVELAHDGWDAWERMCGLPVNLLLTDLEMPRMDGYTLIEKVRKEKEFRSLPILVLSSRTGEENQRRARQAGADGFLYKPVNRRVIVARLKDLLQGT